MTQLQHYLSARKHAAQFRKRWQKRFQRQGRPQDDLSQDDGLVKKYATFVAFDFEAASRLKDWDALGSMVEVRVRMGPLGCSRCWIRSDLTSASFAAA